MTELKAGILLWSQGATWPETLDAVKRVDRLGYDHLWTWDHLYAIFGDPYQPILEGWTSLAAWAMATDQTRLGLLVGANTFRNPGLTAKSAATLDHISNGRAILGIGGAWVELEHRAHGIDFGSGFGQRLDWLDEAVGAMRAVLDGKAATSEPGGRYAFDDLRHQPLPVQPHLPIMIGGSGEKKTLRTVATYADMWNAMGTPEVMAHKVEVLHGHCEAVGRDIGEIEFTLGGQTHHPRLGGRGGSGLEGRDGAQPDADGRRRGRRNLLERVTRADRRPPPALRRARLPHRDLGAARAVRRRDPRALHRRGEAADRPRLGTGRDDLRESPSIEIRSTVRLGATDPARPH